MRVEQLALGMDIADGGDCLENLLLVCCVHVHGGAWLQAMQ